MSRLDYSKWDHIEISDDEDDTHPNVDTPSLFRWRHQARLDRMKEREQEWSEVKQGIGSLVIFEITERIDPKQIVVHTFVSETFYKIYNISKCKKYFLIV